LTFTQHPASKGRVFSHVKFLLSGAAPMSGDLMVQVSKMFPNAAIGQGYGKYDQFAPKKHTQIKSQALPKLQLQSVLCNPTASLAPLAAQEN
jgi:acyl-CoA synthetase (AMP-forming)/AMP-acid ligase II